MAHDPSDVFCKAVQPDQSLCSLCSAGNGGLACWEVEASPCCHRARSTCDRCPVFIGYLRSTARPARVLIATNDGAMLEGNVFLPPGARVSDMLNHPERAFVPVSRPTWRHAAPAGDVPTPVVILSLAAISWVAPIEEEERVTRVEAKVA